MPIFKKCGPKTCEKYYTNYILLEEAFKNEENSYEKFILNRKLISFDEIPGELVNNFLNEYKEVYNTL